VGTRPRSWRRNQVINHRRFAAPEHFEFLVGFEKFAAGPLAAAANSTIKNVIGEVPPQIILVLNFNIIRISDTGILVELRMTKQGMFTPTPK
jgi:hypothetical protein